MTKIALVFLFVICQFAHAISEENSFGILGGGALANISSASVSDAKMRTGVWLGVYWEVPIANRFNFSPELNWVHKGYYFGTNQAVSLHYLQVPLLTKFRLTEGEGLKMYLYAGPALGYVVQKTYTDEAGTSQLLTDSVLSTNNVEISAHVGFGMEFPISDTWRMGLQARYDYGLTSAFKSDKIMNRVILVGLTLSRSESYKYDNIEIRALEYLERKKGNVTLPKGEPPSQALPPLQPDPTDEVTSEN